MLRTVVALMLREIATTYGRSAGGYIWAVLEPVLGVALLSVLFSMALRSPGLGTNFPLFYATGFLPFAMFNDIANKVATSIRFSRPFLAYPCVTFVDTMLARVVLNALTHATVIGLVLTGIHVIYQLPVMTNMLAIFESLLLTTLLAVGVGAFNCYMMTAFPVYERAWHIATRPLFLVSGVFFLYEIMPAKAQALMWFNPLLHCVGIMRRGVYPTYEANYVSALFVISVSVILLFFGLLMLVRNYRILLER
ncbi:capsular polysaccharide transport system permease protein [Paracoccus halophilus]|uniref:Transport permease protein n=1 Tax=Paracoccus halophilus TaxID=376733 RepID=A0A099F7E5_9RHOB|nr:ABC transporter permease [Paracoccus halophilus]KGJ06615.1 sugar ABC transporter permease [Paracoccus halophilus]SFA42686.1 capsular polysaccharide transport system permease protein [Paracoccus halophilus]